MTDAEAKTELGIVPEAREVFGRKYQRFTNLVAELTATNEAKKQLEAESKSLNQQLVDLFADSEFKTVVDNGAKVTLVQSSSVSLDKTKLLELGVAASVIVAATNTKPYQFVKVTAAKE